MTILKQRLETQLYALVYWCGPLQEVRVFGYEDNITGSRVLTFKGTVGLYHALRVMEMMPENAHPILVKLHDVTGDEKALYTQNEVRREITDNYHWAGRWFQTEPLPLPHWELP